MFKDLTPRGPRFQIQLSPANLQIPLAWSITSAKGLVMGICLYFLNLYIPRALDTCVGKLPILADGILAWGGNQPVTGRLAYKRSEIQQNGVSQ